MVSVENLVIQKYLGKKMKIYLCYIWLLENIKEKKVKKMILLYLVLL